MIPDEVRRAVQGHPYPLLFATVSGAHLYGFPSIDSDWDLRGAHVLPAENVLGLLPVEDTVELSSKEGVELDIVSHDVRKFFSLLLKANGYVLEQLYSPIIVLTSPEHEELKSIAQRMHHAVSRSPLPGIRSQSMEAFPEGRTPSREATSVCVSRAVDWDSPYGNGRSRGKSLRAE